MDEPILIIHSFGALFGLFLSVVIFFKRENSYANRLLSLTILVLSTILWGLFFKEKGTVTFFRYLVGPLTYLYWPLFYLYVSVTTRTLNRIGKRDFIHFIPAVLALLYYVSAYLFFPDDGVFYITSSGIETDYRSFSGGLSGLIKLIYGWIYLFSMFKIIKSYRRKIEEYFSRIERINLLWLSTLVSIYLAVWSLGTLVAPLYIAGLDFPAWFTTGMMHLNATFMTGWICAIGYFVINQPDIFKETDMMARAMSDSAPVAGGVEDSIAEKLTAFMESSKPFFDCDLNLSLLAEKLDIQPYLLSRVINSHFEQNFYGFINGYRVDAVKERLKDPDETENLLSIAFDCGFRSKSGFNSIFRKVTGMSPTEYRIKASSSTK